MRPILLGLLIGVSADVSVNDGGLNLLRTAEPSIKKHNYGNEASDPSACKDDDECHSIDTKKPYCMKGICRICWMAPKDECKGYCKWVDEYHRLAKEYRSSCELNTSEFPGSDSCNYQDKKETCQNAGCHWIRATVYVDKSRERERSGYRRACVSEIDCTETHFGSHCKPCWQNDGTPCKSKDQMGHCYTTKNESICGEGCDSVKPAMSACFCGGSMCSIGQTCSSQGVYMTLRSGDKNHPRVCTSSSCVFNIKALIQNADDTTCGSTLRAGERCKVNCKIDYKDSGSLECSTMGQLSQIPTCTRFNETTELLVYVQSSITIKYISKVLTNITSFITETLKNNIAKFLKNPTKNIIILDVTRTTDSTFVVKFRVAVPDDRSKSDIQTTLGSNTFSESIIDSVTTIITTVTSVKVEVGSATILTIHQRESVLSYECGPETAAAECLCGGEKCQPFHICDNGKCTPPDCLVPNITNALNFDCGDTLKPGKECTVTCESDYRPSGSLKCGESMGLMSTIMVCRPVDKDVVETDIYVWSFVTLQITTTGSWETVLRSVKQSIVETLKVSEADMKIPKAFKRGFRYLVQFGLKVTDTATQSDLSQNVDSFNTTTFINQMAINIKDTKVLQVNIGQTSISKIHRVSTTAPPHDDDTPPPYDTLDDAPPPPYNTLSHVQNIDACGHWPAITKCLCESKKVCQPGDSCNVGGFCTSPSCEIPKIKNVESYGCGKTLQPNQECNVKCAPDYNPSGTLRCSASMGQMSRIIECKREGDAVKTVTYVWSYMTLQISNTISWETLLSTVKQSITYTLSVAKADVEILKARKNGLRYVVQFRVKAADNTSKSRLETVINSKKQTFVNQITINIKSTTTTVLEVDVGPPNILTIDQLVSTPAPSQKFTSTLFICLNGYQSTQTESICDGVRDCDDSSDEANCAPEPTCDSYTCNGVGFAKDESKTTAKCNVACTDAQCCVDLTGDYFKDLFTMRCDEKPAMGACQCGESVCTVGERCNRSTIPACTNVNIYEVRSNITLTVNSVPEIHESNIKIVMTRFIAERLEVELHHVYIIKIVKNVNLETRYTVEFRVRVYDEVNSQKLETTITTGVIFQTTTINITIRELTYTISTTNVKVHSTTTSMINEPASTPALSQNIECEDNRGKTQVGKTCSCVNPENGFLTNCMAGHYCLPSGECTKENVENVEFAVGNRRQFVVLRPQNVATCGSYEKCVGFFEVDQSKKNNHMHWSMRSEAVLQTIS
eukprot:GEMP01005872.1.p1 GENE.GEMP01005872.1~~GEMP01005872.1.p1  ORF type:complete len:1247 (+),score=109.47 GEMP01005872.1:78-3818(+)